MGSTKFFSMLNLSHRPISANHLTLYCTYWLGYHYQEMARELGPTEEIFPFGRHLLKEYGWGVYKLLNTEREYSVQSTYHIYRASKTLGNFKVLHSPPFFMVAGTSLCYIEVGM